MAGLSFSLPFSGGGGIGAGMGIPGLPPLNLSNGATSGLSSNGAAFSASGAGDWSVNLGGSGTALQSATGGLNWMLIAAGAAAWFVLRK